MFLVAVQFNGTDSIKEARCRLKGLVRAAGEGRMWKKNS